MTHGQYQQHDTGKSDVPLMLSGGFKRRDQAVDAVSGGAVHMVSMARAMALDPQLAETWMTEEGGDADFPRFDTAPPGGITAWFTMLLTALSHDCEDVLMA